MPIDIVMVTYNRIDLTRQTLDWLFSNTDIPFRLIVVDNHSTDGTQGFLMSHPGIDLLVLNQNNLGLEEALSQGFKLVESDIFVTMDNDILVPKNWLSEQLALMETYKEYAVLARRPQELVGVGPIFAGGHEVVENNVVGGVARMMRRDAVAKVGGWSKQFVNNGRGNEEWNICTKLREAGFKVGYISNQWAYHQWGDNHWGYKNVDYKMGRCLAEAPKDIPFDPLTCEPSIKKNQ